MGAVFNSRISDFASRGAVLTCAAQAQGAWHLLLEARSARICYTSKRPRGVLHWTSQVLSKCPRGK